MHINFVTPIQEKRASYRYRVEAPAMELAKLGHHVSIGDFNPEATTVVFSKHFDMDRDLELIRRCEGRKVFDICDNHFTDDYASYYKSMCKLADRIIVGTHAMMLKLDKEVIHKAVVINDPYEFPLKAPRFNPVDPKLLWFGHSSNLYSLQRVLPEISDFELRVISNTDVMPSIPWSMKAMKDGFEWCDLVIIPETEYCKGANRAIESFRSGRFVVADPHPSLNFTQCHTGGIREGIEWAMQHPKHVLELIERAQIDIESLYSPENIGAQWERALV